MRLRPRILCSTRSIEHQILSYNTMSTPELIEKVIVFTSEQILGRAIIEARIFAQMLIYSSLFYCVILLAENTIVSGFVYLSMHRA